MEQTTSRGWRMELEARTPELYHLMKSDPDPRVRHRGHALLLVAQGRAVAEVARLFQTAAHCVRAWRSRFLSQGRAGLVDRSRCGRPPKLDACARAVLEEALDRGPQAYGLPMTIWSLRDLHRLLLQECQVQVSLDTVHRAVGALGYRYRRPRHDLTHRQDHQAVAATQQVLAWLEKKALLSPSDSIWSLWMSVKSTPTRAWQRSGSDEATL
jgi:transposase